MTQSKCEFHQLISRIVWFVSIGEFDPEFVIDDRQVSNEYVKILLENN